jgi:putative flippase GtrA
VRFIRYIFVQVVAYGFDMGGFLLMFSVLGMHPVVANLFGKMAAGVFAFFTHRSFTFRLSDEHRHHGQAVRYFVLLGINLPLSAGVLSLVLLVVKYPVAAKFIADVICVLLTYWLSKTYVFISHRKPPANHATPEGPAS